MTSHNPDLCLKDSITRDPLSEDDRYLETM